MIEPNHTSSPAESCDSRILSWMHFGDLHITTASEKNYRDFLSLIAEANHLFSGPQGPHFAVLPGDNADDGTEEQFRLVRDAVEQLRLPVHILPGDHDFKTGSLTDFYDLLGLKKLPYAVGFDENVCLFLNSLDAGSNCFDFGPAQVEWLAQELQRAGSAGKGAVLFMHTYPSELSSAARKVAYLIRHHRVLFVDMGHTHYNEVANDGGTIYAATRSTGQVEEGAPGHSVTTIDAGVVAWKFRQMGAKDPFVMITSPADQRFIIDPQSPSQVVRGQVDVRAKIWGQIETARVTCQIDFSEPQEMQHRKVSNLSSWTWNSALVPDGEHRLTVRAENVLGSISEDSITVLVDQAGKYQPPARKQGDNANAIGAYESKGILGTQLGPNKNGRKW